MLAGELKKDGNAVWNGIVMSVEVRLEAGSFTKQHFSKRIFQSLDFELQSRQFD